MLPLAEKCVFYKPEIIGKGEAHGIEILRFLKLNFKKEIYQ